MDNSRLETQEKEYYTIYSPYYQKDEHILKDQNKKLFVTKHDKTQEHGFALKTIEDINKRINFIVKNESWKKQEDNEKIGKNDIEEIRKKITIIEEKFHDKVTHLPTIKKIFYAFRKIIDPTLCKYFHKEPMEERKIAELKAKIESSLQLIEFKLKPQQKEGTFLALNHNVQMNVYSTLTHRDLANMAQVSTEMQQKAIIRSRAEKFGYKTNNTDDAKKFIKSINAGLISLLKKGIFQPHYSNEKKKVVDLAKTFDNLILKDGKQKIESFEEFLVVFHYNAKNKSNPIHIDDNSLKSVYWKFSNSSEKLTLEMRFLLELGAFSEKAFYNACSSESLPLFQEFIEIIPDENKKEIITNGLQHVISSNQTSLDETQLAKIAILLEKGADINKKIEVKSGEEVSSKSILSCAIENGANKEIIELLLEKGANPNELSSHSTYGETLPIYRAMKKNDTEIVALLLRYEADVNKKMNEKYILESSNFSNEIVKLVEPNLNEEHKKTRNK